MIVSDLSHIEGRRYPARRRTQNLAGGVAPIQAENFAIGNVTLDPDGGQVPWHNQEQEEVYFVIEGTGEMCLGTECRTLSAGQMVYIPPGVFHQLTNIGSTPLRMIYCYGPSGDVAHWRQELAGADLALEDLQHLRADTVDRGTPQAAIGPDLGIAPDARCHGDDIGQAGQCPGIVERQRAGAGRQA